MSYYEMKGVISGGFHVYRLTNEDGIEIASGEGESFDLAIADLRTKLPPTDRQPNDEWWVFPLDETTRDYADCGMCGDSGKVAVQGEHGWETEPCRSCSVGRRVTRESKTR